MINTTHLYRCVISRVIFAAAASCLPVLADEPSSSKPIAFVGGQLLDGYEAPAIADGVIVFTDGVITRAGAMSDVDIPEDAEIIDVGGHTILPGLIDNHVHVDLIGHGSYERYYAFLGGTERLLEVMPIAAKQMLRAGVTTGLQNLWAMGTQPAVM